MALVAASAPNDRPKLQSKSGARCPPQMSLWDKKPMAVPTAPMTMTARINIPYTDPSEKDMGLLYSQVAHS